MDRLLDVNLQSQISLLDDVRCFLKERADLEREFAKKLENLSRKYDAKRQKRLSTAEELSVLSQSDEKSSHIGISINEVWSSFIKMAANEADLHTEYADKIALEVCEKLKKIGKRKDVARAKHLSAFMKIMQQQEKIYAEKDAARKDYLDACENVEAAKSKHDRAPDDRTLEKSKRFWHEEILNMNNAKNHYIISLMAANAVKHEFYATQVPDVFRDLIAQTESATQSLASLCASSTKMAQYHLSSLIDLHNRLMIKIEKIDPELSVSRELRLGAGKSASLEPDHFRFAPCMLWRDFEEITCADDVAKGGLLIRWRSLDSKREGVERDIEVKRRGIEGLKLLRDAYRKGNGGGDPLEVEENIYIVKRELNQLQLVHTNLSEMIRVILEHTGVPPSDKFHSFKSVSFAIPTSCQHCRQTIWGVARPGICCTGCGFNAHAKCELKVPLNCPKSTCDKSMTLKGEISKTPQIDTDHWKLGQLVRSIYEYPGAALNSPQEDGDTFWVHEGDILEIIDADDGSGWLTLKDVSKGTAGYVPKSYVEKFESSVTLCGSAKRPSTPAAEGKEALAAFDYTETGEDEISMTAGQKVWILDEDDGSGWAFIFDGKREGLVPASYLTLTSEELSVSA